MKVKIGKYAFNLTATRAYLLVVFGLLLVPLAIGAYQSIPFYYQSTIKLEYQGQIYTFDSVVKCSPDVVLKFGGPVGGVFFGSGRVYPRFLAQELPDGRQLIVNNNKCDPAYLAFYENKPEAIDIAYRAYPLVMIAKDFSPDDQVETYFGSVSYNAPNSDLKLISQSLRRASFSEYRRFSQKIGTAEKDIVQTEELASRLRCFVLFEYSGQSLLADLHIDPSTYPSKDISPVTEERTISAMSGNSYSILSDYHGFYTDKILAARRFTALHPISIMDGNLIVHSDVSGRGICSTKYAHNFLYKPGLTYNLKLPDANVEIHSRKDAFLYDSYRNVALAITEVHFLDY